MGKKMYVMNLKNRVTAAATEEEALDSLNGRVARYVDSDYFTATELVDEELTAKMLILCRTMTQTEKFELSEVKAAVRSLITRADLRADAEELVDSVIEWTERLDDLDEEEFMDWLSATLG